MNILRILLVVISLCIVFSGASIAQDNLSDGEVINVPAFVDQPVNLADIVNVSGVLGLTTLFISNNGNNPNAGVYFDIENVFNMPIRIVRWDINCIDINPTADISVYTRIGTFQGFEATMSGWTLIGTQNLSCAGDDLPTPLGVGGFIINPGQTIGIAMVNDGGQWEYTNGNGSNQIYNNGQLEIRTGSSYRPALQPGGSFFSPRVWNGTIYYELLDTSFSLAPLTATNEVLTDHTVTATILSQNVPLEGVLVNFQVIFGPNSGESSDPDSGECTPNDDCTTDENGEVSWTYSSSLPGTDTIVATVFEGGVESNRVEKTWIIIRNIPTLSEWGLIAMAGILGLVGFIAIRKKYISA